MARSAARKKVGGRQGRWQLQDAKARFSELVRKVQAEGPQHVTIHGRDSVVVIAEDEYRRLTGGQSGKQLVELMAASPLRDVEFDSVPVRGPVRDVEL